MNNLSKNENEATLLYFNNINKPIILKKNNIIALSFYRITELKSIIKFRWYLKSVSLQLDENKQQVILPIKADQDEYIILDQTFENIKINDLSMDRNFSNYNVYCTKYELNNNAVFISFENNDKQFSIKFFYEKVVNNILKYVSKNELFEDNTNNINEKYFWF